MSRISNGRVYRWGRATAALLMVTAASGCATLPTAQKLAAVKAPDAFAAASSLPGQGASWPSDNWWAGYKDPQLSSLIAEGLADATDLRIADARFAKARAVIDEARSTLLPSVTVNAQPSVARQSENYLVPGAFLPQGWQDYGQGDATLRWQLDFWGKNRATLAAARSDAKAAGAEAAAARLAVSSGIASAYATLAAQCAELDAANDALAIRTKSLALMKGRRVEGLENEGAVDRAAAALAGAQGDVQAVSEAIDLSRHALAALMGAGPDRGLAITRPAILALNARLPDNLPADLIGRRPDIIAARSSAQSAASRIKVAKASFYPSINLTALIGLQSLGLGNLFKSGSVYGSAGPAISLPIFDGGRLRAQYRGAEADYQVAVAQYDATLVQALREVADAATSQRALAGRVQSARRAEEAARSAWQVAGNRYRGGLGTYLDVLTAEDALVSARRTVASLNSRAFALDVTLIRALGGGYQA